MSRRSGILARLCNKLESRFSRSDSLYLQAKKELETHAAMEVMEPTPQDWSKSYCTFIKSASASTLTQSRH